MPDKPVVNPQLAILAGVIAVSFSALFVRLSIAPPLIIATYRLLFTFMVIAPFTLLRHRQELLALSRREIALAALSGAFLALHFAAWFTSLQYTTIASSVVLVTTQPIFVVIGSYFLFREKVSRLGIFGGGIAMIGSFIIGAGDFKLGLEAFYGDLLALLAAVMVSGYMIIGRKLRGSVSLSAYTFVVYGSSALVLALTSLAGGWKFAPYPPQQWLLFFALALICTVGGHTVFNWVIRYVPASTVAVCILGESLGAIIWGAVFLREYPGWRQIVGGVVIFSGLLLFYPGNSETVNGVPQKTEKTSAAATGLLLGISAYLVWGFFPIYFKALETVPPLQVVSHRIVWSALLLAILITVRRGWGDVRTALSAKKSLLLLITTALLIAVNWLVFIIAVGHAEILQSSLGYFITPFVSVILGIVILKERLRRLQIAALLLALAGVTLITLQQSGIPWAALTLAVTFGTYGLLRKTTAVDAITGLAVETFLLAPVAVTYLLYVKQQRTGCFLYTGLQIDLLLVSAGLVTSIPLLMFAAAARRLRMATIGFLQYITPSLHFLIAVVLYREPFRAASLVSFGFIWLGLAVYSLDAWLGVRQHLSAAYKR